MITNLAILGIIADMLLFIWINTRKQQDDL